MWVWIGRGAVEAGAGAGAAADRFVVLARCVAEQEVVHRRLGAGDHAQRAEHRVAGGLGDLGIAGDDRGARVGRQERSRRDDQGQRLQAAVVQRDVVTDQAAEHIQHRGARHGRRRVEVALVLRAGAGEIHDRAAGCLVHADRRRTGRGRCPSCSRNGRSRCGRSRGAPIPRRCP